MLNGDGDEEEEDESEEEDEESEEEDEEDDVEPTQAKGRQLSSASASAQKKALSRKEAQSSSDDDDSHKEETPVKVTVLAAPAVPTAEGKEPLASKSVPAKDPAPKATEMETSQRVVVQNGAQDTPAVASVRTVVLSDELRAENLAFLRDMRGICVKLVEEAKTQSLLISEGILEEVCAKTSQIVEDATEKSSRIMEELRMVLKRLGAIAGQNEWMNSSGINYSGNLFQGMVFISQQPFPNVDYSSFSAECGLEVFHFSCLPSSYIVVHPCAFLLLSFCTALSFHLFHDRT
jgi:hypothetical protein